MTISAPVPITPLPTVPLLSDISTFSTRTDAFINALPTFRTENNALASNVYSNALDAEASSTEAAASVVLAEEQVTLAEVQVALATTQAVLATAATGAAMWVSGTNYTVTTNVYSPITVSTYRCKVAGVSTIDPSLDPITWLSTTPLEIPSMLLMSQGII